MTEKQVEKKQWEQPKVTEFDVSERTMSGDGLDFDGRDPEPGGGDGGAGGGGGGGGGIS